MAFNDTAYKHRRGLRSRPRNTDQMEALFEGLRHAVGESEMSRAVHARRNYPARDGVLRTRVAQLEALMPAVRQEQARNSRDPQRRRLYGAELTYLSKRARAERRLLMRMLGEWK